MRFFPAVLAALVALLVAATAAPASSIFNGDLETGDRTQWSHVENCATDRATVFDAAFASGHGYPAPHQGQYALRLNSKNLDYWFDGSGTNGECNDSTHAKRSQVSTGEVLPENTGTSIYEGFDFNLSDVPSGVGTGGNNWMLIQEDHGFPWLHSPPMEIDVKYIGGVQSVTLDQLDYGTGGNGPYIDTTRWSVAKDSSWHRMILRKKMSTVYNGTACATCGYVELWLDGVKQTFSSGVRNATNDRLYTATMDPWATNHSYRFYLNSYRGSSSGSADVPVYFDNAKVGTNFADVDQSDTQAPTVPGSFTSTSHTSTNASFSWTASTDNSEVDHYNLYRDGVKIKTFPGTDTTGGNTGLTPSTTYSFRLSASDAAGNESAQTSAVSVTTNP